MNFRRSSVCCGGKILRADSLSSYKLEEVASTTSDQSFPLWWIIACFYTLFVIGFSFIPVDDPELRDDHATARIILLISCPVFLFLAANMAGGVGCCRRASVYVYFKGPQYLPGFFIGQWDVLELPPGSAQGTADTIAKSIMAAKDRRIREKYGLKAV